MRRFYASIQGNQGQATRTGTPNGGITGHIRGWNVGCYVSIHDDNGHDVIQVYSTGGSNGSVGQNLIATLRRVDGTVEVTT